MPDGGFYVWLTVPEGVDAKAMLPRAVTARVAYVSGTGFYADGFGSRQLRLSYCYPTPERITEGVRRLAGVLEAELDVMRTFGSPTRPTWARRRPATARQSARARHTPCTGRRAALRRAEHGADHSRAPSGQMRR